MQLSTSSWYEIQDYLRFSDGVIIPVGSIEQHGPIGLIGTDTFCVEDIAEEVGKNINALIAPTLAYTPAEFNMKFPGTISISPNLFEDFCRQVFNSFARHGFKHLYILNGHGANLVPLRKIRNTISDVEIRIKSWWDFTSVNELRNNFFGDWEGMHATPAEISITQVHRRTIISSLADTEPELLSKKYIEDHAGDNHGDAFSHRQSFPDGRVGSHSALARREYGIELMTAAVQEVQKDYLNFLKT